MLLITSNHPMIDTNILLYAYDRPEPVKQPKALAVLDRLVTWRIGVLTPTSLKLRSG